VECHIRCTSVPGVIYDVTSEYPAVAANLGIWELIRAQDIRIEDCTREAREFLSNLTVEQLLDRSVWPRLAFFAKIKPHGEAHKLKQIDVDIILDEMIARIRAKP